MNVLRFGVRGLQVWNQVKVMENDFKPGDLMTLDDPVYARLVSKRGKLVDDFGRVIGNYELVDLK